MQAVCTGLIGLAAIAFVLAIVAGLSGGEIMLIPAESFSRASSNSALIAIALLLTSRSKA